VEEKITGVRDEVARATGRRHAREFYSKPEERKRVTGFASAIGSRLKIQRATANPNAA
jgi:hypothetical protein